MNCRNQDLVQHYFWAFIIVLASVRGAFVYHLSVPPNELYIATGIMLIVFGLLSLRAMLASYSYSELALLNMLIKVNILFFGFYTLINIALKDVNYYAGAYQFLIFPIIFVLIKYDRKLLRLIINLISLITVVGIFYFYNIGVTGGFDAMKDSMLTLRPGELAYSRIGENLLPAGYQGDHHDAANIMVMCSLYFLSHAMTLKSGLSGLFYTVVYFICLFALILTGSAANIAIAIFVSAFALIVYASNYPWRMALYIFLFILIISQYVKDVSHYLYFLEKFIDQRDLEGGGMFNSLNLDGLFSSLHSILFGFGDILEVPMINSEVAFIKQLVSIGIVPFLVFSFILFSPYFYLYKFDSKTNSKMRFLKMHRSMICSSAYSYYCRKSRYRLVMAAMPCLAGALTLLHYGSLFRVTSVGLFCVLLALFFSQYIEFSRITTEQFNSGYKNGI
jgi:hypothetical protein